MFVGMQVFNKYGLSWTTELNIDNESCVYYVIEDHDLLVDNGYKDDIVFGDLTKVGNQVIAIRFGTSNVMTNKIKLELRDNPYYYDGRYSDVLTLIGMDDWIKGRFMIICSIYLSNAQLDIICCTSYPIRMINEVKEYIRDLLQSDYIGIKSIYS